MPWQLATFYHTNQQLLMLELRKRGTPTQGQLECCTTFVACILIFSLQNTDAGLQVVLPKELNGWSSSTLLELVQLHFPGPNGEA